MASWVDLWYADYDYNWTYTWAPDNNYSYLYDYFHDDLSGYTNETKIKNILDQIVECNYTGKKVEPEEDSASSAEIENETEVNRRVGAKIRTADDTEASEDAEVNGDNRIDGEAVCGISDADLTAAMHYAKKGSLIDT